MIVAIEWRGVFLRGGVYMIWSGGNETNEGWVGK